MYGATDQPFGDFVFAARPKNNSKCRAKVGAPNGTRIVLALQRPRETWEGSPGPLNPTNYRLFHPIRCPKIGVRFHRASGADYSAIEVVTNDKWHNLKSKTVRRCHDVTPRCHRPPAELPSGPIARGSPTFAKATSGTQEPASGFFGRRPLSSQHDRGIVKECFRRNGLNF